VTDPARTPRCDRARAGAALAPDGELPVLERRLLDAHLAHCACCRAFASDVTAIVSELRVARPARPARRFALPAACARRSAYNRVRAVGAVAVVAAMSVGIAMNAPLPAGSDGAGTSEVAPTSGRGGGLQTIRQLQREALLSPAPYPDRPSRSFGNHPA
jgi:hypothetical protein